MKATVLRRQMLASIRAAMTPVAALAANENHGSHLADQKHSQRAFDKPATDPVFAAIEKHREAERTWRALLNDEADKAANAALERVDAAFVAWLTTPPTTMAGVVATLEHAAVKYGDPNGFDTHTNLAEAAQYVDDTRKIGEQFPAMIATALRKIASG